MKVYFKIIFMMTFIFLYGCTHDNLNSSEIPNSLKNSINQAIQGYVGNVSDVAIGAPSISDPIVASELPHGSHSTGKIIGEFSTEFKNATESRFHNISLASSKIDEAIVEPGEEFSFNKSVGPTVKSNGFKLGRIFINGKDSKGYGGGVCQVSSTLFNASNLAGMEITERHDHSKPVEYVEKGKDAATSYGAIDFKFVNNKPHPIKIDSYVMDEKVVVSIVAI